MLTPLDTTTPPDPGFTWQKVGDDLLNFFTDAGLKLLSVATIIVVAFLLSWLMRRLIARIVDRIVRGAKSKADTDDTRAVDNSPLAQVRIIQRTRTLGSILGNIVNTTIVLIALILIVFTINQDILGSFTLLTAALGAGLGFGAQNIVKDVLNGIFIVAEDQVGIGDVVDLGLATGVVEYVSVRVTNVRDVNGTLWYVRNGEITRIGNMSQGWSRVIIDLAVPVDADVSEVEKAMLTAAKGLAKDAKWRTRLIDQPEIWGLESISGDALVIRLVQKTRTNAKDDVARELRMRLKHAIDELGVTLPQLNSIVLSGTDGAQRVRGANPPRTRPTPVATEGDAKPVWKPRRTSKSTSPSRNAKDAATSPAPDARAGSFDPNATDAASDTGDDS